MYILLYMYIYNIYIYYSDRRIRIIVPHQKLEMQSLIQK